MRNKRPGASARAERRNRIRIINDGFSPVSLKDLDTCESEKLVTFSSLTIKPINGGSRARTFIVHTKRPVRWGVFVERVTEALLEVM